MRCFPNAATKLMVAGTSLGLYGLGAVVTFAFSEYTWHWVPAVVAAVLAIYGVYTAARGEERTVRVFDLRRGSVAFLIGDPVLVVVIGFLAAAWSPALAYDHEFVFFHMVVGVVVAVAVVALFRILDCIRYKKADAFDLFHFSPSKLWHDFGTALVLIISLVTYSAPQWYEPNWPVVVLVFFGLLIYAACGGIDLMYPPNPRDQHFKKEKPADKPGI